MAKSRSDLSMNKNDEVRADDYDTFLIKFSENVDLG